MAAELQLAVDTGDLCEGLNQKITMSFTSNFISYTSLLVRPYNSPGSFHQEGIIIVCTYILTNTAT